MNPVLIVTHNGLEHTKRCGESLGNQTIPVDFLFVDNGSTDGTVEWLSDHPFTSVWTLHENRGVSFGWNVGIDWVFRNFKTGHVLVVGNDTILPSTFYSDLLSLNLLFVTGHGVPTLELAAEKPWFTLSPHPEFNAFLIRREVWEKVGPFDESMISWASDCDYHVRAHRLGIPLMKAGVPFYHYGSATTKDASASEQEIFHQQAHLDREVFRSKYGCLPGTPAYEDLFKWA